MPEEIEQSIWNAAGATLQRVHQLLVNVHECALGISPSAEPHSAEQRTQQLVTLDRIYTEVSPYIAEKDIKGIDEARKEVASLISKAKDNNDPNIYQALLKYEHLLRRTKWMQNMLMPRMDDPTLAMRG